MIKKMFLIIFAFLTTAQMYSAAQSAQENNFQELIYNIGISLTDQNLIVDAATAKQAIVNLYEDVADFAQIVDVFVMIDEEMVEQKIVTIDQLVDYHVHIQPKAVVPCIAWLIEYQYVFCLFRSLHADDISFDVWCDDIAFFTSLEDDEEPSDPDYFKLWNAVCDMLDAQEEFEDALKN